MRSKAQTAEAHSSIQEAIPEDLHNEIHKVESNIVRDNKGFKTLDPVLKLAVITQNCTENRTNWQRSSRESLWGT